MAETFQDQVGETGQKGGRVKRCRRLGTLKRRQRTLACFSEIGANTQTLVGESTANVLQYSLLLFLTIDLGR